MTFVANVDPQLGAYAASFKGVTTTTCHGRFLVIRVDSLFHRSSHLSWGDSGWLKYSLPGHEYYAKSGVLDKAHERIYVKSVNKAILVSLQWEDRTMGRPGYRLTADNISHPFHLKDEFTGYFSQIAIHDSRASTRIVGVDARAANGAFRQASVASDASTPVESSSVRTLHAPQPQKTLHRSGP